MMRLFLGRLENSRHLPKSSRADWKCHFVLNIHQTVRDGDAEQRGGQEYRETLLTRREDEETELRCPDDMRGLR